MCGVGAIIGFLFALIPQKLFNIKLWKGHFQFETNGTFYEKYLKINLWKDLIPQFSKMFHFGYRKDKIPVRDIPHYEMFMIETIRAEITHMLLIIFSPLYYTYFTLFFINYQIAVHKYFQNLCADFHWVAVCNKQVSIFAFFDRAYSVFDTDVFCRVDCNSLQGSKWVHTCGNSHTCAVWQMLLWNYRGVSYN